MDKRIYDKSEIDNMLKNTKEALEKEVKEMVTVGSGTPVAPTIANSTLAFTIVKSETK